MTSDRSTDSLINTLHSAEASYHSAGVYYQTRLHTPIRQFFTPSQRQNHSACPLHSSPGASWSPQNLGYGMQHKILVTGVGWWQTVSDFKLTIFESKEDAWVAPD